MDIGFFCAQVNVTKHRHTSDKIIFFILSLFFPNYNYGFS